MESALLFFFGKRFDLLLEMSRNSNQKFGPNTITKSPRLCCDFSSAPDWTRKRRKVDQKQEKCEPMSELRKK